MTSEEIIREIALLPPEGQQLVADFVACLRQRYESSIHETIEPSPLRDEEFIGMWKDREHMQDSSKWVRELRQSEWVR